MSRVALSALVFAAVAYAQDSSVPTFPATPLISFSFPHPTDAPEQVYGPERTFVRGPQSGYNRCNSTTENQDSLCQTSFVNDITGKSQRAWLLTHQLIAAFSFWICRFLFVGSCHLQLDHRRH